MLLDAIEAFLAAAGGQHSAGGPLAATSGYPPVFSEDLCARLDLSPLGEHSGRLFDELWPKEEEDIRELELANREAVRLAARMFTEFAAHPERCERLAEALLASLNDKGDESR
jgi:hypothetical protein